MKATFAMLVTIVGGLVISSCGTTAKTKAVKPATETTRPAEGPELIGRIASIPADKRFVLIQRYGKWKVETGKTLTTRGPEDRTANLLATGESLGEFAAADLQSGRVEVGDAVYSQHVAKPVEPPAPATNPPSDAPKSTGDGPVTEILKNN
jgi:hypothetical protein